MSGSGDTTSCLMSVEALSIRPSLRSHLTQFEKIKMRTRRSEKLEAEPLGVKSESEANAKVETKKPTVKRKVKSDPSVKLEPGPSSKLESGSSVKDESKPKVKLAAEEHQHEVEMEASEDEEEEMESTSREGDSVPDPGVYKSVRKPNMSVIWLSTWVLRESTSTKMNLAFTDVLKNSVFIPVEIRVSFVSITRYTLVRDNTNADYATRHFVYELPA